jgi:hypothetical protein
MPCAPRFRFAEPLTEKFWIGTGVNDRYARRDGRRRVLGYLGFHVATSTAASLARSAARLARCS